MFGRKRIAVSITTQGAFILLLALAVFGWGLHAKLAQYEANANTITTQAKLSTEERSADLFVAVAVQAAPTDGLPAFPSRIVAERSHRAATRQSRFDDVAVRLRVASWSLLSGPASMLRPPPALG